MAVPAAGARDARLDALRGFAVTLVVLGHALVRATGAVPSAGPGLEAVPGVGFVSLSTLGDPLLNIVYTFHIPLFAFVAGLVMERSSVRSGLEFVKRRFLALMVPYLAWLVVAWVVIGSHTAAGFVRFVGAGLVNDQAPGSLWFLYALFVSSVIFAAVRALGPSPWPLLASALVVGAAGMVPVPAGYEHFLGLSEVAWLYPFVVAGVLVGRGRERVDRWRGGMWVSAALWALTTPLVWPLLVSGPKWWQPAFAAAIEAFGLPGNLAAKAFWGVARVIGALAGVMTWYFVFAFVRGRIQTATAWLGRNSLGVYAIHGWFLLPLGVAFGCARVATMFIIAMAASTALTALLKRFAFTRAVFLGMRAHPPRAPVCVAM